MNGAKLAVFGIVAFIALLAFLILNPLTSIKAGHRGVVTEFGAVSDTILDEGIHWVTPIMQKVVEMNVQTQKEEVAVASASKDLQTVTADIALNYHLNPESINHLYQNTGKKYKERIIDPAIQEAVKAVTAQYTAEELVTKRQQVKVDTQLVLTERLAEEFITVTELSIVNFNFSASFNAAIEAKVTAEQDALAAKNKLEQIKFEAEQRVSQAQGEAEAIRIQAQAIQSQGGKEYVELKSVEKWNGVLPSYMMSGGAVPFINIK